MDDLDVLAETPILRGLSREDLAPLLPVRRRLFPKGSIVWLEGDAGTMLDVVVEGRIKTSRVTARGEELLIQYETPGSLCGLPAALVAGATRMTQGEAIERAVLISIERESFLSLMERQPVVMRRVLDNLARTARAALSTLSDVGFLDVRGRVAQKLLDLAELYGKQTADGTQIGMRISQKALAGMVAASREKVNRALVRLAGDGIIRNDAGSITILQADLLRDRT